MIDLALQAQNELHYKHDSWKWGNITFDGEVPIQGTISCNFSSHALTVQNLTVTNTNQWSDSWEPQAWNTLYS